MAKGKKSKVLPVDQGDGYKVGPGNPPLETRFKPGESGNPNGRPAAGATVREWLNVMATWELSQVDEVLTKGGEPMAKILAAKVWKDAAETGASNFDRIMDRTEGKPSQAVELYGKDGGPIQTEHYDLSKLTDEELIQLREIRNKAAAAILSN